MIRSHFKVVIKGSYLKFTKLMFLIFLMNIFTNENVKALDKLVNKIIYALKTDNYQKPQACSVELDMID